MEEGKDPEEVVDKTGEEKGKEPDLSDAEKFAQMGGVDLDVNLELEEKEKSEPVKDPGKEKKEPEKKEPEVSAKEKELADQIEQLKATKKDLQKALHEARQERKKSKEPDSEVKLTDVEIKAILKEHKDDPEVMFNALIYKMQQAAKTGKVDAVKEVEIKNRQRELTEVLRQRVKDYDDENSEVRVHINNAKANYGLEDHPHGDFLTAAAELYIALPAIAKNWFEEGKKAALGDKAEDSRKKGIKEKQLGPGGSKNLSENGGPQGSLTASQLETANRLGFTTPEKRKLYLSQILKNSPSARKEA